MPLDTIDVGAYEGDETGSESAYSAFTKVNDNFTDVQAQLDAKASSTHDHDEDYAAIGHTHSGLAPTGGTTGQVLKKVSDTNYDYAWASDETGAGGTDWGDIGGTLADQTDLQAALNGKSSTSHDHSGVYSPVGHDHDADYAAIGHTHAQLHDAATVADTDTIDMAISGQQVSGSVKMQMSITSDSSGVKLSGDSATPGNSKLYGTNASGTKGWYDIPLTVGLTFVIDGGGSTITTGIKGDLRIPFACTITKVTALADQSGSIVVDVWKDTYANYPPADADSITASAPVTISSATKSEDSTLTGWTKTVSAGDILRFNVDSVTSITRLTIVLDAVRT